MDPNLLAQPEFIFFHYYAHCVKKHTDVGYANVYTAYTCQIYVKSLIKGTHATSTCHTLQLLRRVRTYTTHLPPADHPHPNTRAGSLVWWIHLYMIGIIAYNRIKKPVR